MSNQSDTVRDIFDQVVDLPPPERAAALGRLTDGNPGLRAEVEQLLASHDAAHVGNFMSSPTAATTIRNAVLTETPGSRVGPYKLLQVIGEGGFGTVFLAEQTEPVRRRVALKIIKLGMDTKQVIARFEAERQALALMDHPHIARVLDAGATPVTEHGGGRPYFVMEYVVGDAITQFADANNLDIRARLQLFAQVCSAVQHAHTKGIIHRDIKPGNVLVTMTDGKPFARVIDFGIAKATSSAAGLTDKTLFTEHRQLIGTPEYMSPEQAQGSPDIDTRTDVYALGVLLYELLAGDTPFDGKRLRSAAWDEMRRIIKEEEPPTPSARVTQRLKATPTANPRAHEAAAVDLLQSRSRGLQPARSSSDSSHQHTPFSTPSLRHPVTPSLSPSLLRGELDWIVMKSLDKDRARRYETPSALAADVMRHLQGEAVQAAPPSAAYRMRKFVRRHKVRSGFAAVIGLGVAGTLIGLAIAQYNARAAIHNGKIAQAARDELAITNASLRKQAALVRAEAQRLVSDVSGVPWSDTERYPPINDDGYAIGASGPATLWAEVDEKGSVLRWGSQTVTEPKDDFGTQLEQVSSIARRSIVGLRATTADLTAQTDAAEWSAYTANLALAQAAMDAGNWPEARERLAQCPESKRGWEWQWLNGKAASITAEVRSPFSVVSPEAQLIASMDGGSLQMFRIDGTPASARTELDGQISWATFSENGQRLLIACYAGPQMDHLKVFDLNGNRIGADAATDILAINSASISPDGSSIAASTTDTHGDAVIAIFNTDGSTRAILAEAPRSYLPHTWSPDGSRLAAICGDELRVWTRDGTPVGSVPMASTPHFRPDGAEIVFLIDEMTAATWPIGEATFNTPLNHERKVGYVGYSPDGKTIYTTCADNLLRLWRDGIEVARVPCDLYEHPVFSPDGDHFVVKNSASLTICDADGKPVAAPLAHPEGVQSFCFAPDGKSVYSSDYNSILHWGLDGRLFGRTAIGTRIGYPQCLPDGRLIATLLTDEGGDTYNRILLPATSGEGERRLPPTSADIARLEADAILHDGRLADRAPGGTPISQEQAREIAPGCVAWAASPDRKLLASAAPDRVVRFWDVDSKKEAASLRLDADVASLTFTDDGTRLVVTLMNGAARFLDTRSASAQAESHARREAERAPAAAYVDALLAGPTPTADLESAVINDVSLTPLRRLVAAEMLQERRAELYQAAERAFDTITKGQTDKQAVLVAAAALEPSADLPPRTKEKLLALAEAWEYQVPELSDTQKLAEEQLRREEAEREAERLGEVLLAEVDLLLAGTRGGLGFAEDAAARFDSAARMFEQVFGENHARTREAKAWALIAPLHNKDEWMSDLERVRAAIDAYGEVGSADERNMMVYSVSNAMIPRFRLSMEWLDKLPSHDPGSGDSDRWNHGALCSGIYLGLLSDWSARSDEWSPRLPDIIADCEAMTSRRTHVWQFDAKGCAALALARLRADQPLGALEALSVAASIRKAAEAKATAEGSPVPPAARGDSPMDLFILVLIRSKLSGADENTITAAAEVDGKPQSLTRGKALSRNDHLTAALSALSRARAIMADPAALDDSGRQWSENPDARALLAEAEALIAPHMIEPGAAKPPE